jgi:hypothetical protein
LELEQYMATDCIFFISVYYIIYLYNSVLRSFLSTLTEFRCKGTTKNAHLQEKRAIFAKKIDFIYLHTIFNISLKLA